MKNTLKMLLGSGIALAMFLIPITTHAAPLAVSATATSKATVKPTAAAPDQIKEKPTGAPAVSAATTLSPEAIQPLSLAVRQQAVVTQFRDLITRFTSITARTQATIDRLAAKDIDTTKAQVSLTAATTALQNAKLATDAFAALTVPDETGENKTDKQSIAAASLSLKDSAKKTDDYLKTVRVSLIQSLSELKTSIAGKSDITL